MEETAETDRQVHWEWMDPQETHLKVSIGSIINSMRVSEHGESCVDPNAGREQILTHRRQMNSQDGRRMELHSDQEYRLVWLGRNFSSEAKLSRLARLTISVSMQAQKSDEADIKDK